MVKKAAIKAAMRVTTTTVIPGRPEGASPESIHLSAAAAAEWISGSRQEARPRNDEVVALPGHTPVLQHEAGAARLADAVAEIVGLRPRVGTDAHLVEGVRAAAAHHRAQ